MLKRVGSFVFGLVATAIMATTAFAGPYDPVYKVDDLVITEFEIEQRAMLQAFLGATGNQIKIAEEQLIEDRVKQAAAKRQGITLAPDQLLIGMDEFASRGGLTAEELISLLESQGIYRETLEAFVQSGIIWQQVVSSRFGFQGILSDSAIDAELAVGTANTDATELLLAEIVISFQSRGEEGAKELAARIRRDILNGANFGVQSAQYSESPTAADGGLRDWSALNSLPDDIVGPLIVGGVGAITEPVEIGNNVAILQLRGIRTNSEITNPTSVEYMVVPVPAGADLSKELENVDTCNDMRAVSNNVQPQVYTLSNVLERAIAEPYASVIDDLDLNEFQRIQRGNGQIELVMVCSRQRDLQEDARERLRNLLGNQRVNSFGAAFLQELLGNATITRL